MRMISSMGLYEADIGLLVTDGEAPDKRIVLSDLKYAIVQASAYPLPVANPESSHLRVVRFHDSVRACRDAGLSIVRCEVPEPLEKTVERYGLKPASGRFVHCLFYERPPGPLPEEKILAEIEKLGDVVENVIFHPLRGCIEIHYSPEASYKSSADGRFLTYLKIEEVLGARLRSVNGLGKSPKVSQSV